MGGPGYDHIMNVIIPTLKNNGVPFSSPIMLEACMRFPTRRSSSNFRSYRTHGTRILHALPLRPR